MQNTHFLLLKKLKNTESAQLCSLAMQGCKPEMKYFIRKIGQWAMDMGWNICYYININLTLNGCI